MTRQANLVGAGVPAPAVVYFVGTVSNTQTASGSSSQANSFAIANDITIFTTAASNSGARLPSANPGDNFIIANYDANTMIVYPPVGGILNGGSLNAGVNVTTKKSAECVCIDALNFIVMVGG